MKTILLLVAVVAIAHSSPAPEKLRLWENFKITHSKVYANAEEESFRKDLFLKKLAHIEEHNAKYSQGLVSYELGVNKFTDFTEEEMRPYTHGISIPKDYKSTNKIHVITEGFQAPDTFDWRDRGVINPVKNQGGCGSCWAFATNGALEPQIALVQNNHVSLSEQNLVDCVPNNNCGGGWMTTAYQWIKDNGGIDREDAYPYEAVNGPCRYNADTRGAGLNGWIDVNYDDEGAMVDALVNRGPLATAIEVSGDWGSYSSGVFYNSSCTDQLNHGVTIVGYGNENGLDYWLVRNSWGPDWGLGGYIKMARNVPSNCGISHFPSVPTV